MEHATSATSPHDRSGSQRIAPLRQTRLQVNVSFEERQALVEHARAGGYDSVAAYVRARTLDQPSGP